MDSTDIRPVDAAKRIRDLNDAFRTTFVGGVIALTDGIDALSPEVKAEVLNRVREFDRFTEDVESRWRAVPHRWDRFRHPALRTGHAGFPASSSLCAAQMPRVVLMVAIAR
jgi:hypothetical protein